MAPPKEQHNTTPLSIDALKALMPGIFTKQEELLHGLSHLRLTLANNTHVTDGHRWKSINVDMSGHITELKQFAPVIEEIQSTINTTWPGLAKHFAFGSAGEGKNQGDIKIGFYSELGPDAKHLRILKKEIELFTYEKPEAPLDNSLTT